MVQRNTSKGGCLSQWKYHMISLVWQVTRGKASNVLTVTTVICCIMRWIPHFMVKSISEKWCILLIWTDLEVLRYIFDWYKLSLALHGSFMWQMKICLFAFQREISATVIQKVTFFFFLQHVSPRLTLLLLNQYKSFLTVALTGAVWFKYCTRECNFHHSVVELLSMVFCCNNVTRLIFQTASENIWTVFSHPYCYDFHTIL